MSKKIIFLLSETNIIFKATSLSKSAFTLVIVIAIADKTAVFFSSSVAVAKIPRFVK